jgi:hypothetical protein
LQNERLFSIDMLPLPPRRDVPHVLGLLHRLAVLLAGTCAALAPHWARADPYDRLYPGLTVVAPTGKQPSTIMSEKAQCADTAQGDIQLYANCLEEMQYTLNGSAIAPPTSPQKNAATALTLMPANGSSKVAERAPAASANGRSDLSLYGQVTRAARAGDAAFKSGDYAAAMRDYMVIENLSSSIAAIAAHFDFEADKRTIDLSAESKQSYVEIHALIAAQRSIGLMYERG